MERRNDGSGDDEGGGRVRGDAQGRGHGAGTGGGEVVSGAGRAGARLVLGELGG